MSFQVTPGDVQSAAQNLANIHSSLEDASATVAAPTTGVAAAAEDQVSAGVAAVFSSFGEEYQVLSAQAQAFHAQFVAQLGAGAGAYLSTEIANAQQSLAEAVGSPTQGLLSAVGGAGGAASAVASSVSAAQPAALPILGGLGSSFFAGGVGGMPVATALAGAGGGVGSLLGGLGGGTPAGSLLGGLDGASAVPSLNGVVGALQTGNPFSLLGGPIGTGLQALYRDVAALPAALQSGGGALAPGLLHAGASAGSTGGPYQTLFEDTTANLHNLGTGMSANPAPLLQQTLSTTTGYLNTIASQLPYGTPNFPTILMGVSANIQTGMQGLLAFDPALHAQHFFDNQVAYGHIWPTSLQNAGHDLLFGPHQLPAAFKPAWPQLQAGNVGGAFGDVTGGFLGAFAKGLDVTATGTLLVTPAVASNVGLTGASADLNPMLTIPGPWGQYLTSILPPGSIATQIAQNTTNVINTVTDMPLAAQALVTTTPTIRPPSVTVNAPVNPYAGSPTALGGPLNALDATSAGLTQFIGQLQTGDPTGAITTLVGSPAYISDSFLNGH